MVVMKKGGGGYSIFNDCGFGMGFYISFYMGMNVGSCLWTEWCVYVCNVCRL